MGAPPYQAPLVDVTRRVTPGPWRAFFDSLAATLVAGGPGSAGSAGAAGLALSGGPGLETDPLGAAIAEVYSLLPPAAPAPSFTPGSVIFAGATGGLAQDNANLFWNDTTNRLGIGLTPVFGLDLLAAGVDIGYVARFRDNATAGSSFIMIAAPAGANAQSGFTLFQTNSGHEWRFAGLGANGEFAWRVNIDGLDVFLTTITGNVIINNAITDPTTGSKCLIFGDGTAPSGLDSNTAGLYANDVGGTVNMFAINEAGEVTQLSGDLLLPTARILKFGGSAATEVALKRASTVLEVRLADDSAYAALRALRAIVDAGELVAFDGRTRITAPADGNLLLTDDAAATFGRLQLGGTSSSFPAVTRAAAVLEAKLADDSAYTDVRAFALRITDGAFLLRAEATLADGVGAAVGTLTNAPTTGDPAKYLLVDDNGTTYAIPAWAVP